MRSVFTIACRSI